MTLEQLLKDPEWTQERVAVAARTSQGSISRISQRKRKVSLGLALRLERATEGRVTAEELPMTRKARKDLQVMRAALRDAAA